MLILGILAQRTWWREIKGPRSAPLRGPFFVTLRRSHTTNCSYQPTLFKTNTQRHPLRKCQAAELRAARAPTADALRALATAENVSVA